MAAAAASEGAATKRGWEQDIPREMWQLIFRHVVHGWLSVGGNEHPVDYGHKPGRVIRMPKLYALSVTHVILHLWTFNEATLNIVDVTSSDVFETPMHGGPPRQSMHGVFLEPQELTRMLDVTASERCAAFREVLGKKYTKRFGSWKTDAKSRLMSEKAFLSNGQRYLWSDGQSKFAKKDAFFMMMSVWYREMTARLLRIAQVCRLWSKCIDWKQLYEAHCRFFACWHLHPQKCIVPLQPQWHAPEIPADWFRMQIVASHLVRDLRLSAATGIKITTPKENPRLFLPSRWDEYQRKKKESLATNDDQLRTVTNSISFLLDCSPVYHVQVNNNNLSRSITVRLPDTEAEYRDPQCAICILAFPQSVRSLLTRLKRRGASIYTPQIYTMLTDTMRRELTTKWWTMFQRNVYLAPRIEEIERSFQTATEPPPPRRKRKREVHRDAAIAVADDEAGEKEEEEEKVESAGKRPKLFFF